MTAADDFPLNALQQGELTVQGEFLWGSNYTFLVQLEFEGTRLAAVYKPSRGERPLWDFPTASLAHREVAAYLVSEVFGWQLVPPTVHRKDGPAGAGSLQVFIDHDPEYHYFNFSGEDRQRLRPVALFDLLINNADRKGSHILIDPDDHLWLIDHGICFHVEDKHKTVIWDFAGEAIAEDLLLDVERLLDSLKQPSVLVKQLSLHLSEAEIGAMIQRGKQLMITGHFPNPDPNQRILPWPPI